MLFLESIIYNFLKATITIKCHSFSKRIFKHRLVLKKMQVHENLSLNKNTLFNMEKKNSSLAVLYLINNLSP